MKLRIEFVALLALQIAILVIGIALIMA